MDYIKNKLGYDFIHGKELTPANGELLFNWRCSMAKAHALDYIIVHEMCYMYHKNHYQEYCKLLSSIIPDYEVRKSWLKNYGVRLDL
ncbi:M48 family metallopeptidase [Clostridium gasigenes]